MRTTNFPLFAACASLALAFICSCENSGSLKVVSPSSSSEEVSSSSHEHVEEPETYSCGNVIYDPANKFCDSRDNQIYKKVEIGEGATAQVWMAENLNYNASGSKCYNNSAANCAIYGRLYTWATAMNLPAAYNSILYDTSSTAKYPGICPVGWYMPNSSDWDVLMNYVQTDNGKAYMNGGHVAPQAGNFLKAKSGWDSYDKIVNYDKYGFSALPGGTWASAWSPNSASIGRNGYWWSSAEYDDSLAYYGNMAFNLESANWWSRNKSGYMNSVRCIKY
jgi:uncharacterized protein (TIGR02145 family)